MNRILAALVPIFCTTLASAQVIYGGSNLPTQPNKPPANSIGVDNAFYFDFTSGNMFGPKTQGQWPPTPINTFGSSTLGVFNTFTVGGGGGSIWTDIGTGTAYNSALRDRLFIGNAILAAKTFNFSDPLIPLAPGDGYLLRGAINTIQHPLGLSSTLNACATSLVSTTTPAYFTVSADTSTDNGNGTPNITIDPVAFQGGHGSGATGAVTMNSSGGVASIHWHATVGAGGYWASGRSKPGNPSDVITPLGIYPGLPTNLQVTVTDTNTPATICDSISGTNDNSNTDLPVPIWGHYADLYHKPGAGATVFAEWHVGNAGDYVYIDPYTTGLNYNTGQTEILTLAAGGSSSQPTIDYVNPISDAIRFGSGGRRIGIGINFVPNSLYSNLIPLHTGTTNIIDQVAIAFGQNHKVAWYSGANNVGSYIRGLVTANTILDSQDATNHGWVFGGPAFIVQPQDSDISQNVTIGGSVLPQVDFQLSGNNGQLALVNYNVGQNGVEQNLFTRNTLPAPGVVSTSGDYLTKNYWFDDGVNWVRTAQLKFGLSATPTMGVTQGFMEVDINDSTGTSQNMLHINQFGVVNAPFGPYENNSGANLPTPASGSAYWEGTANGGSTNIGFGTIDDHRWYNNAKVLAANIPAGTTNFHIVGTLGVSTLPTSAGGGGLFVCIDTSGNMYKKATCP